MYERRALLLAGLLCAGLAVPVGAAEHPAAASGPCRGVWIRSVPEKIPVRLGTRRIRPGDLLTPEQLENLIVYADRPVSLQVLPIRDGLSLKETTVSLRGSPNKPPEAADSSVETYRNLPRDGLLDVRDPEGQPLSYRLLRAPKRGSVILRRDGSFLYTPAKNKIGTDSFVYAATDPGGKSSEPATVTVRILPASADRPYSDTDGNACRFAAEWLRETGIFAGETVDGIPCFSPDEPVSRGQFLTMVMAALKLPADRLSGAALPENTPLWLRPYLTAALRAGIIRPKAPDCASGEPIPLRQAAALAQKAAALAFPGRADDADARIRAAFPGGALPDRILTRSDAAVMLYSLQKYSDAKVLISSVFRQ